MKMSDSLNGALGIKDADTLIASMLPNEWYSILFWWTIYFSGYIGPLH